MNKREPLVSVCLITYNHATYIRDAIDGVLAQQVNFEWVLIIADDGSTDGTRDILLEYKSRFSDQLILILQKKNVGPYRNWMDLMETPTSKYVAYFEGDDYWTDSLKLQKQVDYLEANPSSVFCGSLVNKLVSGRIEDDSFKPGNYDIDFAIQNGRVCQTVSWLFKNVLSSDDYTLIHKAHENPSFCSGDQLFLLLLLQYGNANVLDDYMAVYRIHGSSIMRDARFVRKHNYGMFLLYREFNDYTKGRYSGQLTRNMIFWLELIIEKELILSSKTRALKAMAGVSPMLFLKHSLLMPYYVLKSIVYKFRKRYQ